ncbi:MAG: DUF445 family protein [Burkholderiaceae bacterium]|nr:DUF445 family protein [Burkholderiaceae bacterium]
MNTDANSPAPEATPVAHDPDARWQQENAKRLKELNTMRRWAGALLAFMTVLFIASSIGVAHMPWLAYVRAFAEASMVGACADWFAVVALFRHPLGIPIPHTAVLPRNKDKIGENFGRFVSNNFLAPREVEDKLDRLDLTGWAADWLANPENAELIADNVNALLPSLVDILTQEQLRQMGSSLIRKGIDSIEVAPLLSRTVSVALAHGYEEQLFDRTIAFAVDFLKSHREDIRQRLQRSSKPWVPSWVDARVADGYMDEIDQALQAAEAPDHPWRADFRDLLREVATQLGTDAGLTERLEVVKSEVLSRSVVEDYLAWMAGELETLARQEMQSADGALRRTAAHALTGLGNWLKSDQETREQVNKWIRDIVRETLLPRRAYVGEFVAEVVARWDATTFVERLEVHVGRDLQYIRINGTLIGGLVGLLIYCVERVLG